MFSKQEMKSDLIYWHLYSNHHSWQNAGFNDFSGSPELSTVCWNFGRNLNRVLKGIHSSFRHKQHIDHKRKNRWVASKESKNHLLCILDVENRSLLQSLLKELQMMNMFVSMVDYPLRWVNRGSSISEEITVIRK